jgi:hypothetical protein
MESEELSSMLPPNDQQDLSVVPPSQGLAEPKPKPKPKLQGCVDRTAEFRSIVGFVQRADIRRHSSPLSRRGFTDPKQAQSRLHLAMMIGSVQRDIAATAVLLQRLDDEATQPDISEIAVDTLHLTAYGLSSSLNTLRGAIESICEAQKLLFPKCWSDSLEGPSHPEGGQMSKATLLSILDRIKPLENQLACLIEELENHKTELEEDKVLYHSEDDG